MTSFHSPCLCLVLFLIGVYGKIRSIHGWSGIPDWCRQCSTRVAWCIWYRAATRVLPYVHFFKVQDWIAGTMTASVAQLLNIADRATLGVAIQLPSTDQFLVWSSFSIVMSHLSCSSHFLFLSIIPFRCIKRRCRNQGLFRIICGFMIGALLREKRTEAGHYTSQQRKETERERKRERKKEKKTNQSLPLHPFHLSFPPSLLHSLSPSTSIGLAAEEWSKRIIHWHSLCQNKSFIYCPAADARDCFHKFKQTRGHSSMRSHDSLFKKKAQDLTTLQILIKSLASRRCTKEPVNVRLLHQLTRIASLHAS